MKKSHMTVLTVAVTICRIATLIKGAEQWVINANRVRADPSPANLTKLALASGVLLTAVRSI
ncbi:hypothetical protein [Micromonospora craniellae]|uniref:Uncharacterized protein n=1 Tax=Micromonospora craniellae TaxID=2294034 RepID=A0A372FS05_9ACTN|nr:hypothetical protein [Micromonospora craniellae]QOC94764.1 hypothetical protein ID554_15180 [Micromonospora craniellae]RFS43545.1 hypothetical protein D0Q02_27125 [Micromonospora craniellae]